jgi:hypothetical protein
MGDQFAVHNEDVGIQDARILVRFNTGQVFGVYVP